MISENIQMNTFIFGVSFIKMEGLKKNQKTSSIFDANKLYLKQTTMKPS